MAEEVEWFKRFPGGGTRNLAAFANDLNSMAPLDRAVTLANAIQLGAGEVAAIYERAANAEAEDLPPLSEENQ